MAGEPPNAFQNFIQDSPGWETLDAELQYANDYIQVFLARVRTPSRPEGVRWTVAHRKGAALVAPVTAEGRLVLIRQERVPIRATIWEFPAGQIDSVAEQDEAGVRAVALRELREEAGYELAPGGMLEGMGVYFPSSGFTDEHVHLFVARSVRRSTTGTAHDEGEAILEVREFGVEAVRRMVAEGEIRDANTLCAFARMSALGIL